MTGTFSGRTLAVATGLLCAAGCVSIIYMDAGLTALVGERVDTAIAVLGKPTEVQGLGSDTLYVWEVRRIELRSDPRTIDSPSDRPGVMTTYTGPRYTAVVPIEHYCNVRLLVDSSGRIIKWTHNGDPSGCRSYNKALKAYAEQAHAQKIGTPTH